MKCMLCDHEVIIGGNDMYSDVYGVDVGDEDDAMITNCQCPYCGTSYEVMETLPSERKKYPYWKNRR